MGMTDAEFATMIEKEIAKIKRNMTGRNREFSVTFEAGSAYPFVITDLKTRHSQCHMTGDQAVITAQCLRHGHTLRSC